MALESEARKTDPEIQKPPTLDNLLAFEERMRSARAEKKRKKRKT